MSKLIEDEIQELYFNAVEQISQTKIYDENQKAIRQIKDNIINDFPNKDEILIDKLISAVMESVSMEYEFANACIISYIDAKLSQIVI